MDYPAKTVTVKWQSRGAEGDEQMSEDVVEAVEDVGFEVSVKVRVRL